MKTIANYGKDSKKARLAAEQLMDKLLRKGKRYVFVEISIKGVKVKQRNEKEHQLAMQRIRRAVKSS